MLKHAYGKGMKSQSTTNIAADKQHLYVEVTEDDDLYKAMLKCEKDAPVTGKLGPDGKKNLNQFVCQCGNHSSVFLFQEQVYVEEIL